MNESWGLVREVLSKSVASVWEDAREEWVTKNIFKREGSECLCGKYPVTKVIVLINECNGSEIEVGRCCAKKFFKKEGAKFDVLSRVREDKDKSLTEDIIVQAYAEKVISEWEFNFYSNTVL